MARSRERARLREFERLLGPYADRAVRGGCGLCESLQELRRVGFGEFDLRTEHEPGCPLRGQPVSDEDWVDVLVAFVHRARLADALPAFERVGEVG